MVHTKLLREEAKSIRKQTVKSKAGLITTTTNKPYCVLMGVNGHSNRHRSSPPLQKSLNCFIYLKAQIHAPENPKTVIYFPCVSEDWLMKNLNPYTNFKPTSTGLFWTLTFLDPSMIGFQGGGQHLAPPHRKPTHNWNAKWERKPSKQSYFNLIL